MTTTGPGPWCGTTSGYSNHECRCRPCTDAWRDDPKGKRRVARHKARRLAEGRTANGVDRSRPYDERALAQMRRFDLDPDPRFLR